MGALQTKILGVFKWWGLLKAPSRSKVGNFLRTAAIWAGWRNSSLETLDERPTMDAAGKPSAFVLVAF